MFFMKDFSSSYRRVAHFGLWAEVAADRYGDRDAWNVLCDAIRRCTTEDLRDAAQVSDALAWFEKKLSRPRPVKDFRQALEIVDPVQRFFAAQAALKTLGRNAGLTS